MRGVRLAAEYETRLRRGRERAVRERRVRKLQTQGMSHARELLSESDANGAAAARRRTRVRRRRAPRLSSYAEAATTQSAAAAAAVYVAPNARVVDFAVRRKPHTSTRALEVGIVDEGRSRNGRRRRRPRTHRPRTSATASPRTRIRTLKRALRACVTAAFASAAFPCHASGAGGSIHAPRHVDARLALLPAAMRADAQPVRATDDAAETPPDDARRARERGESSHSRRPRASRRQRPGDRVARG